MSLCLARSVPKRYKIFKRRNYNTKKTKNIISGLSIVIFLLCSSGAWAQESIGEPGRDAKKLNPLKNVYFGEEHLHTVNSADAFAFGSRNTPDDAYRFCRGEAIKVATTGETVKKKRTLALALPEGNVVTTEVDKSVKDFDTLKVGDSIHARLTKAIAISVETR